MVSDDRNDAFSLCFTALGAPGIFYHPEALGGKKLLWPQNHINQLAAGLKPERLERHRSPPEARVQRTGVPLLATLESLRHSN